MRKLTSVSPAFLKKRWNVPKPWAFLIWFGKLHVTHNKKPSRMISTRSSRSMRSAMSRKRRSKNQEILRFPRSSTRSQRCSASFVSIIAIQGSYTVYVVTWWLNIQGSIESIFYLLSIHSPSGTSTFAKINHEVTDMAKPLDAKNTSQHINLQRNVARKDMIVSMTDTYATSFSEATWSTMDVLRKIIIDMDNLANENRSFKVTQNEIDYYRQNWWVHSNVVHEDKRDTPPTKQESGFKEALSTMQRLKRAEDKKKQDTTLQPSSSSSSWQWQSSWWESDYEHSPQKWDYR